MRIRRSALAATAAAAVLATAGCSGSTSDGTPVTSAQAMLRADVLALSQHAAAGDMAAADAALDALKQDIAAAAAAGQITPTLAQQLRHDIAAVNLDLESAASTTSPVARRSSTTPTPTPPHSSSTKNTPKPKPKPAKPKPPGHVKHGHGHGHGHGHDDEDG